LLSALFAIALLDSPSKALAVVVLYVFIQNLERYWFAPMIMQKQVELLPAATLIAQIFFASFLGPLGLVLALPLTVVTKTWVEEAWIKDILDQQVQGPIALALPTDIAVETTPESTGSIELTPVPESLDPTEPSRDA
jgi:predicted PurR-regulated permease PerM